MLRVDPVVLDKAARNAEDLSERIRSTFGENEVRTSGRSLETAELMPFAELAAASVEESRQEFVKRILSHSEAIAQAGRAFEKTTEVHEALFGEMTKRIEANRR